MIRSRNPGQFGIPVESRIDIDEYYDQVMVPYKNAPAIRKVAGLPVLLPMRFSLLPSWSKEAKVKFATHNARLESIDEKPTWKTVFARHHCIIPMTDFIEPIYHGDFAGHMVAFSSISDSMLFAAGVWDEWVNKESGEVIPSFSIITYQPPSLVASMGHDRCPVFLSAIDAQEWLGSGGEAPQALKDFLIQHDTIPELKASKQREMRPGWEKRK